MKRFLMLVPVLSVALAFAVPAPAQAQPRDWYRYRDRDQDRGPNIDGDWYMNGDPDQPCRIIQRRPDGRAVFVNEHGSRAAGTVRGDRVFIPDWSDSLGDDGLEGRIRGDRIVWPDGSYWSR